ncbi:MAG TPA: hypothetical protein VNT76_01210 [Candidatus Binatus sp.]|nr:hypothetical protein [Candidatus Binatus sp.]
MSNPIIDLLASALPGVDLSDVARAYALLAPHLKAPKRPRKPTAPIDVDTSTLSDVELFAHYKKTAPYADLAFFADCTHADTRTAAAVLLAECFDDARQLTIARPEFYRRLRTLQDRWRRATAPYSPVVRRRALRLRILQSIAASESARARSRFAMVA